MDNLARRLSGDSGEAIGIEGTVERRDGASFTVATASGPVAARRAASCLLDPNDGDTVLVARSDRGAWIVAVLERDASRSAELSVDGDLRIRTARGKIALVAQEGIDVISAATTKIVSTGLEVRTNKANVLVDSLELVGTFVKAEVGRAKLFAESLDHVLDRFSQKVKRSYRHVQDLDQVHAGSMHHRVEKTMRVHAHDSAITADGLVKIDGKQIHVG